MNPKKIDKMSAQELRAECRVARTRIEQLEATTFCRWNCQMRKDMWLAGYKDGMIRTMHLTADLLGMDKIEQDAWTAKDDRHAEQAFEEWRTQHE